MNSSSFGFELTPEEIADLERQLSAPPPEGMSEAQDLRSASEALLRLIDDSEESDRPGIFGVFLGGHDLASEVQAYPEPGSVVLLESSRLSSAGEIAREVRLRLASEPQLFVRNSDRVFVHPEVSRQLILMSELEQYFADSANGSPAELEAWVPVRVDGHTRALSVRFYPQGKLEMVLPKGCLAEFKA